MAVKTDTYADVMQRNKLASERLVLPCLLSFELLEIIKDINTPCRLRFQLFLWRVRYGWSLPPSVPLRENPGWEVADVATGSG